VFGDPVSMHSGSFLLRQSHAALGKNIVVFAGSWQASDGVNNTLGQAAASIITAKTALPLCLDLCQVPVRCEH
jgi:hypothetical protein